MEYLGFWVTRTGIWPINKKVESIVNMTPTKNQKHVHSFIGLVKYYKDMGYKQSHLLQTINALTSNKVKFIWAFVKQKVFNEIKQAFAQDTLLIYLYLNIFFDIKMDVNPFNLAVGMR